MSETALESITLEYTRDAEILKLLGELKEVFENHFDRTWFSLIIDGMPIDFRTVRDIREVVSSPSLYPGEEWQIYQGVLELETFCRTVKRFILPCPEGEAGDFLAVPEEARAGYPAVHHQEVRRVHLPLQPGTPQTAHADAEKRPSPLLSLPPLRGYIRTHGRHGCPQSACSSSCGLSGPGSEERTPARAAPGRRPGIRDPGKGRSSSSTSSPASSLEVTC